MTTSTPHEPVIACEGILKTFRRRKVLDHISLKVYPGQMLGLIGPGGAGKSILVKIICGLLKADQRRGLIHGNDITRLKETALQHVRSGIGMVFQNYARFDFMNVGDNIALPLRMEKRHTEADIRDAVADMLERVALPGIEHKFPNELSGGMKKRVSFARAVIQRPPIVIYDDPTAGLDPVTSAKIFDLLENMQAQGTTSITISHDLAGIQPLCDRWLLLDEGTTIFQGDTEAMNACPDPRVQEFWRDRALDSPLARQLLLTDTTDEP